jgi:hypothetical protein
VVWEGRSREASPYPDQETERSERTARGGRGLNKRDNPAGRRKRPDTGLQPAVENSEGHLNPEVREGWTSWGRTRLPEVLKRDNRAHSVPSGRGQLAVTRKSLARSPDLLNDPSTLG